MMAHISMLYFGGSGYIDLTCICRWVILGVKYVLHSLYYNFHSAATVQRKSPNRAGWAANHLFLIQIIFNIISWLRVSYP